MLQWPLIKGIIRLLEDRVAGFSVSKTSQFLCEENLFFQNQKTENRFLKGGYFLQILVVNKTAFG